MSRFCKLFAVILAIALLCGCSEPPSEQVFTCRGLSITLGPDYTDHSNSPAGENLDFLYVSNSIGFTGVCDSKEQFSQLYPDMTLHSYTELTARSAGKASVVQTYRGIPYYIYTAAIEDIEFTYIAAAFEGPLSYWLLQCYCKSDRFSELEPEIWNYLETVRIA